MKKKPIVIAHRGACGYVPEHTLACKAAAHVMNPDFIEQDVVLTRDGRAVVIHDHHIDSVTDVEIAFPDRARPDGHFYAIDFTLGELKSLRIHERVDPHTREASFTGRFPLHTEIEFRIHTLEEEIEFIQGMNRSRGEDIGIYVELKAPPFHTGAGMDIARTVLDILARYGYDGADANCLIQCFDPLCIQYMKETLGSGLPMVQLIADNSWREIDGVDYDSMMTGRGLDRIAAYCTAIGPWIEQVVQDRGPNSAPALTGLAEAAHDRGLEVHVYTARADALPPYAGTMDDLLEVLYMKAGVDGVFTDFPDLAVRFLERNGLR